MNGSSHDSDPVANISQEYIERLREEKNKATRELSIADAERNAASAARSEAEAWKTRIAYYWDRVEATEKKYEEIEYLINNFKEMAGVTAENTNSVAEAVEILVCITRRMSRRTDRLKKKMRDLQDKTSSADKGNAFLPFMDETAKAIEDAILANGEAIKKCLDVLKAAYLLHISVMGKKRIPGVGFPIKPRYLKIMLKKHTIDLLPYFEKEDRGLVSNLDYLLKIFTSGMAYPFVHDDRSLCPSGSDPVIITFPLNDSPDGYFEKTKDQVRDAKELLREARWEEREKQHEYERQRAKFDGYDKALQAAEDAKKQTK